MRRVHRAPAIQALQGLLYYHLDRATNTVINVSTWQSLADVRQMETLAPMLARPPKSRATSLAATPFSPPRHVRTGLLDSLGDAAQTAAAATGEAARASASAARTVGGAGQRAMGTAASATNKWLYWLVPAAAAAAVAAFLIYLFAKPAEQVAQEGVTVGQSLVVGGLNLDKQVTDSIASLRITLAGITDAASAQAALPQLQEAATQIDKVGGLGAQLSAEQRKVLAGVVSPS